MAKLSTTYGMAGIGIAAAIGFIFALSILSNSFSNNTTSRSDSKTSLLQQPNDSGSPVLPFSSPSLQQQKGVGGGSESSNVPGNNGGSGQEATSSSTSASENTRQGMAALMTETGNSSLSEDAASHIILSSVTVYNEDGQLIGELASNKQFRVNEPVFIRANLSNPTEVEIPYRVVTMNIKENENGSNNSSSIVNNNNSKSITRSGSPELNHPRPHQVTSSVRGNIDAKSSIELELFWNPQQLGEYRLTIYSLASGEKESSVSPIMEIPIKVTS